MRQSLQAVGICLQARPKVRAFRFMCFCLGFPWESLLHAHRSFDVMFRPFTLLFYVFNLCFTGSRLASLFKVSYEREFPRID